MAQANLEVAPFPPIKFKQRMMVLEDVRAVTARAVFELTGEMMFRNMMLWKSGGVMNPEPINGSSTAKDHYAFNKIEAQAAVAFNQNFHPGFPEEF